MEKVEGNDDLLASILVLLPARSIFRFRSVSKRWNSIISLPFFLENYYIIRKERQRLLAYIQQTNFTHMNLIPMPLNNDHNIDTSFKLNLSYVNSSDGLILCRNKNSMTYHIINPVTRRSVVLPWSPKIISLPSMALVCEENKRELVLNYKVVAAGYVEGDTLIIHTFSSKTGRWTVSTLTATGSFEGVQLVNHPLVVNGIIHWFTRNRLHLAVYDLNDKYMMTDESKHQVQLIQLPSQWIRGHDHNITRSSREDDLWLCQAIKCCIRIWMLPNGEYYSYRERSATVSQEAWILMHNISHELPLNRTIIEEYRPPMHIVCFTKLGGLIPWKVPRVALVGFDGRIYQCNLENKSLEEVQYEILIHPKSLNVYTFFPYMEALCLSSYGL